MFCPFPSAPLQLTSRGRHISHTCMPACTLSFTQCSHEKWSSAITFPASWAAALTLNRSSSKRHSDRPPGCAAACIKISSWQMCSCTHVAVDPQHSQGSFVHSSVAPSLVPSVAVRTMATPRCSHHVHAHSRPPQTRSQCRCCHHQMLVGGAT